jgi:CheY-like chemotaxis protein
VNADTELVVILVVEDEELIQDVIQESLVDAGFKPEASASGEKAIASLEASPNKYRALVTDINLEGKLTGWDVARRARELNHEMPVIYTTGKAADEWHSLGVPNSVLLAKPFAPAQIITAVAQLLNATPPIVPQ